MRTVKPASSRVSVRKPNVSGVSSTTRMVSRRAVSSAMFLQRFQCDHVALQVEVGDKAAQLRGQRAIGRVLGLHFAQLRLDPANVAYAPELVKSADVMQALLWRFVGRVAGR